MGSCAKISSLMQHIVLCFSLGRLGFLRVLPGLVALSVRV